MYICICIYNSTCNIVCIIYAIVDCDVQLVGLIKMLIVPEPIVTPSETAADGTTVVSLCIYIYECTCDSVCVLCACCVRVVCCVHVVCVCHHMLQITFDNSR